MKINRYEIYVNDSEEAFSVDDKQGSWCKWEDVEPLLKELEELRAIAIEYNKAEDES